MVNLCVTSAISALCGKITLLAFEVAEKLLRKNNHREQSQES
jgi:hypothetical protein